VTSETAEYCREIETYLCRKNDGHLIRVVGPSFDLVSRWAEQGVPLKVAYAGIDRYFERYYRNGPRRRPVRIDFCEADVLDVFDEWKRAVGIRSVAPRHGDDDELRAPDGSRAAAESHITPTEPHIPNPKSRHASLPAHLERALLRLTSARAGGSVGEAFDRILDRLSAEMDAARAKAAGLRGDARQELIARLRDLDAELLAQARAALDAAALTALAREADVELAGFRSAMAEAAYLRAREAAIDRLVRERFRLPTIAF
jgi:hypothetical protein